MKIFILSFENECALVVISLVLCVNGTAASPLCLVGDFDDQVQQLLDSQMLTRDEIANVSTVLTTLEETLQKILPGSKVIPLGSLATGLSMKFSDADCMVLVRNYHIYNKTASSKLILRVEWLLKQQPHIYDEVQARLSTKFQVPVIQFHYKPTRTKAHVSFVTNDGLNGLEITQMLAFYYGLNDKALTLSALVKVWSQMHKTKQTYQLTSYNLNLVIIFYLQQENIVPPFYVLQRLRDGYVSIGDWKPSFNNSKSVYQLLGGFFEYYSEFNFEEYVVSPVLGQPILKTDFLDIDSLPDELALYKYNMKKQHRERVTLIPKMAVQDILSQEPVEDSNIPTDVADKFISDVKSAAAIFNRLSSDRFLRSILDEDEHDNLTGSIDDFQGLKECQNVKPFIMRS